MFGLGKKTAQVTVDFGILKLSLSGDIESKDHESAVRAMDRLADHRALRDSAEAEYAGAVVRSVKELRDWFQKEIEQSKPHATVRQPIQTVLRGCRTFISEIESINDQVMKRYEGARVLEESGAHLYDDQRVLLETVKRTGSAKLLFVEDLKLMELPATAMTWEFLFSMQKLRTTIGFSVRIFEGIAGRKAPRELRQLLPSDIEVD